MRSSAFRRASRSAASNGLPMEIVCTGLDARYQAVVIGECGYADDGDEPVLVQRFDARVASRPSITGMITSMKTMSTALSSKSLTASAPLVASTISYPRASSMPRSTSRLTNPSSATRATGAGPGAAPRAEEPAGEDTVYAVLKSAPKFDTSRIRCTPSRAPRSSTCPPWRPASFLRTSSIPRAEESR